MRKSTFFTLKQPGATGTCVVGKEELVGIDVFQGCSKEACNCALSQEMKGEHFGLLNCMPFLIKSILLNEIRAATNIVQASET